MGWEEYEGLFDMSRKGRSNGNAELDFFFKIERYLPLVLVWSSFIALKCLLAVNWSWWSHMSRAPLTTTYKRCLRSCSYLWDAFTRNSLWLTMVYTRKIEWPAVLIIGHCQRPHCHNAVTPMRSSFAHLLHRRGVLRHVHCKSCIWQIFRISN